MEQSFKRAPMVTGGGGGDSGREKMGWGSGKVEEMLGKMLAQGIEVWWPEEGDRRKEATAVRADELRSSLVVMRRKKNEMTDGSYIPINIWVLSGRTVRHSRADRPEAGCYIITDGLVTSVDKRKGLKCQHDDNTQGRKGMGSEPCLPEV